MADGDISTASEAASLAGVVARAPDDHGTHAEALLFALDVHEDTLQTHEFLQAWSHGSLEEWPEFYEWLDKHRVECPLPRTEQFYIVWNGARNEGFVTESEADAYAAKTGQPHYELGFPSQSSIGEAFGEAYGDDPVTIEEITIVVDKVHSENDA